MKDAVFDFLFDALFGWVIETDIHAEVILCHEMIVVGMSILVFLAVAQALGAGVMGIAQVLGNGYGAPSFHFLQGTVDRGVGAVALVGGGEINRGLGNGDARFGPSR